MKTTLTKLAHLIQEENEHHVHNFIDYLCLHTKMKSHDLQYQYKNFRSSDQVESKSDDQPTTCAYAFTRGKKSGQTCGAHPVDDGSFCRKHAKTKQSKTLPIPVITEDTFEQDFLAIIDEELGSNFDEEDELDIEEDD